MEDQVGSRAAIAARPAWIVSPAFDLLLLSNLAWPLLLMPGFSTDSDTVVDFWQVYFLTLPHRWITLFLVVVDQDRRSTRTGAMLVTAALIGAVVATSFWGYDFGARAFVCLGFIDYVWNGWHFASQHAGILRIYSRKSGRGWPLLERWGIRTFVSFTILRTSSALMWPEQMQMVQSMLPYLDWCLLVIPATLVLLSAFTFKRSQAPKLIYLTSVLALYSGYLCASHFHLPRMLLCFATAAALFHAVEYLAFVSYYADRRKSSGSPGAMRWLAQRWGLTLACFVITLGMLGIFLSGNQGPVTTAWQGLNLWAALVHYAFDGVIWKLRQPATARSLGIA